MKCKIWNWLVLEVQKMIPPYKWKNVLLRTTGMKIGKDVCIPHYIHFDHKYPELISIEDGCIIGGMSKLISHKKEGNKIIKGKIKIGKNTLLAGVTTINPGVTIGEYVITGAFSNISENVPDKSFVVGKNKIIKHWSEEDMERLFHKSNHDKDYYKNFKKKTKEFRKNKKIMKISILNDGKRMNPGNEWYLARPVWKIYWNAIWVEAARFVPWNWKRILLWRILGAKIGKNVKIGKKVVFDHIYGDLAEIGDNTKIGDHSYIDGHSYTIGETVFGRVKIGKNCKIGEHVHFMCGVTVGDNVTIGDNSSVLKDIPSGEKWKGIPAKKVEE